MFAVFWNFFATFILLSKIILSESNELTNFSNKILLLAHVKNLKRSVFTSIKSENTRLHDKLKSLDLLFHKTYT